LPQDDAQLEEKFELELVSRKMKEICLLARKKNSVSLSTLSVSKAEALLSRSQKLKLYSHGLKS
jgi:hypothetical protein